MLLPSIYLSYSSIAHLLTRLIIISLLINIVSPNTTTTPYLDYCSTIPYNKVTTCNITCTSCKSINQCLTCPPYLQLVQTHCPPIQNDKIKYKEYFYGTTLKFDDNLQYFYTPLGMLSSDNVFRFCIAGKYRFDVIGLFSAGDQLTFQESNILQAQSIALNFRLFFSTRIATVKIQINSKMVYNQTIDSGALFNFTSDDANPEVDSGTKWYIGISQDSSITTYVDQIFVPVRTGMIPLGNTTANIKITVQNSNSNATRGEKFWGISQISVVTKTCSTCVTDFIKNLSATLGIIIGVSSGIVLFLVLILHIYNKIKEAKIRKQVKKKFDDNQEAALINDRRSNRLTSIRRESHVLV